MKENEFRAFCAQRNLHAEQVDAAVATVHRFEDAARSNGDTLESANVDFLKGYIAGLIHSGDNSPEHLVALLRYCYVADMHDLYVYLTGILGGRSVVPSIAGRTGEVAGDDIRQRVFAHVALPPLGSPQEQYPEMTKQVLAGLQSHLPLETCRDILAGNHHRIPVDGFEAHKQAYRTSGLAGLLKYRHETLISELEEHAKSGKPWYEQIITPAVVEMVRQDPEIQAGVQVGDSVFVTKIPYSPVAYLAEDDPVRKRYYQCHCPLARASILDEASTVSPLLCYCSGGYEKLVFDVVFAEPVQVKVVESALAGDLRCRFRIEIPESHVR
ncbi:MAG: hypothetical protein Q8P31_02475 [Bacillota bacterium]|nr:hypothetical protein [Bacillota bacterium]